MVKQSYGVRTPMLSTALDTEITLQKDGVGFKPLPVKFVILTIISGCGCVKVFTSDMVAVGSPVQKFFFVALWMLITVLLFFTSKTQLLNVRVLFSFLGYLITPGSRRLRTRKTDANVVENMLDVTNIRHISENGLIIFSDKSVGYMYRVTGNASALLFESDRDMILNRVDNFYRRVDPDVEFIFMTLKEPQRVYQQAAAINNRHKALTVKDDDLTKLANNQLNLLRDVVGCKLRSVHQYMIIKAPSEESLISAKTDLQVELNQSTLFIRKCVPLGPEDIADQLAVVYASPKLEDELDYLKNIS